MPGKDTRVVDMQFQNQQFEKNIATSQKSLSRFKKELNFDDTSKGLAKFGEAIDALKFDKFFDNVQKLTDKFTGIGRVGEYMISRIRHALEDAADSALRFAKSLTFDQVSAGKQKFEDLNKSIQTIRAATGKTEKEVSDVLTRLNEYTDWTSYNFSDMAANIGKFTSVGIPLEKAEKQMEGIANWAARSGAGIQEASRAMYNLSQAMGVGSLKLIDWKSIENAGMATKEFKQQLIEAGLAVGTLEATVKKDANGIEQIVYKTSKKLGKQVEVNFQNMSQTLNKGWANTDVLGTTLLGYYYDVLDPDLDKGLQELTESQQKLLDDMFKRYGNINAERWKKLAEEGLATDEFKQGLLDTATSMGLLTSEVSEDGNVIYTTLDKTGKKIEFTLDTFEKGLGGTWLSRGVARTVYAFDDLAKSSYEAAQKCLTFSDVLNAWKDAISTGWMQSFQHIFGGLSDSMELFSAMCNKAQVSLNSIFGVNGDINKVLEKWSSTGGRESLWGIIIGEWTDSEGNKMYDGAYGLIDIIGDIVDMIRGAFVDVMGDFAADLLGEDAVSDWAENQDFRLQFYAGRIQDVTDRIQEAIFNIREFFKTVPEGASKSRWEMVKDVVKTIFQVIRFAGRVIEGIFAFIGRIKEQLSPSFEAITDLLYSLVTGFSGTERELYKTDGIRTFFINFANSLEPVTDIINKVVIGITDLIRAFFKWGIEGGNFIKIWNVIKSVFNWIIKVFDKISGPFLDFFREIGPAIGDLFSKGINKETVKNFFKTFGNAISSLIGDFVSYVPGIWSKIKEFFTTIFSHVKNILSGSEDGLIGDIGEFIGNVVNGIISFLKNLHSRITDDNSLFSAIMRIIGSGIGTLADLAKKIRDALSDICLYDIIMGFLGGTAILTALGLLYEVFKFIKAFRNIVEGIGDIFSAIATRIKGDTTQRFYNVAKSILMLAAAIVLLGQMQTDEAIQGVIAVAIGSAIVIGVIWALGKVVKKMKVRDVIKLSLSIITVSASLLVFAAGVFVLVRALKPLTDLSWEKLAKMGAGLAGILYIFTMFAAITKLAKIDGKALKGFGTLGIGIGILIFALKPLADMDWIKMAKMGAGLLAVLLMLAGFSHIVGNIKDKGIGQAAFLAIGIAILVQALLPLKDVGWEGLLKMGVSLGAVLLMLAEFSWKAGSLKGSHMRSTIALALGILLLMESLKPIANYDWEKLVKMGAFLAVVLGMLAWFSNKADSFKGKSMKSAISLALSILLLMESLKPLAEYNWEKLAKMGAMLVLVIATLIVFSNKVGSLKGKGVFGAIWLAASVLLLMESLKPLADYDWEDLGKIEAVLGVTLGLLAAFTKKVESLKGKGIFGAIIIAGSIFALVEGLKPLADLSWEKLAKMGSGLLALSIILIGVSKKMGSMNIKDVFALVIFSANIYLLIKALDPLANYKWEQLAQIGTGLFACVIAFAIAAKAIQNADWKTTVASFAPMLGLAIMISIFGKSLERVKDVGTEQMLAFSGSIVIISFAIKAVLASINELTTLSSGKEIGSKLAMVGATLVVVGALMAELALFIPKINNANIVKLLFFVAAVDLLMPSLLIGVKAVEKINAVSTTTETISKLAMMAAVLISVGVLMAELTLFIPRINDAYILKVIGFSVAVDAVTPSLIIAAYAINKISAVKSETEIVGKFALMMAALVSVGVLLAELALFADTISNTNVIKIIFFAAAVDAVMPSLIIAARAISTIDGVKTKTEIIGKFTLTMAALISVGVLLAELAYFANTISNSNIFKIIGFSVAVDLLMPALYEAVYSINAINVPGGSASKVVSKIALAVTALISVGVLMGELAYFADTVSESNIFKIIGFSVSVDLLMPALYEAIYSINKLQVPKSGKEVVRKIALMFTALIAVGALMFEMAQMIPLINQGDILKVGAFAVSVDALIPSLILATVAINNIKTKTGAKGQGKDISVKSLVSKILLMFTAIIAVGVLMGELAVLIPVINESDIVKLLGFVAAVDLLMPVLIIVAEAINKIKIPESFVKNTKTGGLFSKDKSTSKQEKGSLGSLLALITIAVITVGAFMFELAKLIPLINKIEDSFDGVGKLVGFVIAVDLLMPALILVVEAINRLDVKKIGKENTKNERTLSVKELWPTMLLIFEAVAVVGLLGWGLSLIIDNVEKMEGNFEGAAKLVSFVVAVDLLMPAFIMVIEAIDRLNPKTISEGGQKNNIKERVLSVKELWPTMLLILEAVTVVALLGWGLSLIIDNIEKMEGNFEGAAKLISFVVAVDMLMPALIMVVEAINRLEIPKIGEAGSDKERVLTVKELRGLMSLIGIAVATVAALGAGLALLIPTIDSMKGLDSIPKLIGFAAAVDALMPALIIVAIAINKIEIPKEGDNILKPEDLKGKMKLILAAIGIVAAFTAEMALVVSLVDFSAMKLSDIPKWVGFALAVDALMPALILAAMAINKIEAPNEKGLESKIKIIKTLAIIVGAMVAEMALIAVAVNKLGGFGDVGKLLVFTISVNIVVAALLTAVKAINNIKTPTSDKALEKKTAIITRCALIIGGLMAALALVSLIIDDTSSDIGSLAKLIVFAITINLIMPALSSVVRAFNDADVPKDSKEIGRKIAVLAGALGTIVVLMAALALVVPAINEADILKMLSLSVTIYLLVTSLGKMIDIIVNTDVPDDNDELKRKLGVTAAALVAVAALIAEMSLFASKINEGDATKILAIAGAVVLIVPAITEIMEALGEIEAPEEDESFGFGAKLGTLAMALVAVGALIAELVWVANAVKDADPMSILAIATAITIIVPAMTQILEALGEIEAPEEDENSGLGLKLGLLAGALVAVAALIAEMVWVANSVNNSDVLKLLGFAAAVDIIMVSMLIVVKAINMLETPEDSKSMWTKLGLLAGALIAIAGIAVAFGFAMSLMGDADPVTMLAFAGSVVILSAAIFIVMKSISSIKLGGAKTFAKNLGNIILTVVAIGSIMWIFASLLKETEGIDPVNMLAFAASVVILSLAITIAMSAISTIVAPVGGFTKKLGSAIVAIIALGAIMYVFANLLENTKDIDPVNMLAFSASIVVLAIALSIAVASFSAMQVPTTNFGKKIIMFILAMVAIVVATVAMAKAMKDLKDVKWEAFLAFAASIGILMVLMAAAILILANVDLARGIQAIILLGVAMAALGLIIDLVAPLIGNGLSRMLIELGNGLYQFGTLVGPFADIMEKIDTDTLITKMKGFLKVAEIAGEAGKYEGYIRSFGYAVNTLTGGLSVFVSMSREIPSNLDDMPIFKLIGRLFVYKDLFKTFDTFGFGYKVHSLGSGLKGFITTTSDISQTPEDLPAMQLLTAFADRANDIKTLTGLSSGLATLSGELSTLGGALVIYGSAVNDMDLSDLTREELEAIQDPQKIIGVLQSVIDTFSGDNGLTLPTLPDADTIDKSFAPSLVALGGAVKEFGKACQDIDNEQVGKGLEAIGYVAQIHHALIDDQVYGTSALAGLNALGLTELYSIGMFGTDLITLASGLQNFITACSGIDTKTEQGLAAIGFLADIQHKLTEDDLLKKSMGLFSAENGTNTSALNQFGTDIAALGHDLGKFADKVNFTDNGKARNFKRALKSIDFLKDIATELDQIKTDESLWANIFHNEQGMTLGDLGAQLETIGSGLASFYSKTVGSFEANGGGGFDPDKITQVFKSLTAVIEAAEVGLGYVAGTKLAGNSLVVDAFYNIGEFLNMLLSDATQWGDRTGSVADAIADFLLMFDKSLYEGIDGQSLHFEQSAQILKDAAEGLSAFMAAAAHFGDDNAVQMKLDAGFIEIGTTMCSSIVQGIMNGTQSVLDAVADLVEKAHQEGIDELTFGDVAEDLASFVKEFDMELFGGDDGLKNENTPQILRDTAEAINFLVTALNNLSTVESGTIGPIIDLDTSNFDNKLENMRNNLGPMAKIGGSYTLTLKLDESQFSQITPKDYTIQLGEISTKMTYLQKEINDLGNDIQKMKVVMDTGAVVGAIGDRVDHHIGRNAFFESRLK